MLRARYLIGIIFLVVLAVLSSSVALAELEIKRPLDGATVRETVRVIVPAESVPMGGFISCYIDERFRAAVAASEQARTETGDFVYFWDTKAENPDPDLPPDQRKARDGRHTITVQTYDAIGKSQGEPKTITVYVKNNASSDMPADGLKLRYASRVGLWNKYEFKYTLDVKSIQGATDVASSAGEAVEGAEGVIKRSIEDVLSDSTALVRQKQVGMVRVYQAGQAVPATWISPKAGYDVEDSMGKIISRITSTSPGTAVTIDLPNMPEYRIRIGDTWSQPEKVLRDAMTGEASTFNSTSTLEGLEWESGYPCAKIRTTFYGVARIPFSKSFREPVSMNGEMLTYFAYDTGKLVYCVTTVKAKTSVDPSVVNSLTQQRMPQGGNFAPQSQSNTPYPPSTMEEDLELRGPVSRPFTAPTPAFDMGGTAYDQTLLQKVDVEMEIKQTIKLVP
jgi:hypothetical protein